MRVAFFHPAFLNVGGAEILAATQMRHLAGEGDQVRLATFAFDAGRWAQRMAGVEVVKIPKRHWTDFLAWSRTAKILQRGRRAAQLLEGFDTVVAHNYPCSTMLGSSGLAGFKVWQCNEPPRSLHLRKANPICTARAEAQREGSPGSAIGRFQEQLAVYDASVADGGRFASRKAQDLEAAAHLDLIYAISEFSRANARSIYGKCADEVIYPIVRFPEGGHSRSGLDRSGLQVLIHSRLESLKNIDTAIRGFALFAAAHPGARLHVVGDGPERQRLQGLAAEILPEGAHMFHGYLPEADLRSVYERCDVFALLTLDEPFGMVYPEAAAKGLLLIGPDHGGPSEILEGGRLGWCVDPFAPEALAQALEQVWALPDGEADRRRGEADRACRARFSESVIGPRLRRLISKGRG
jgi:glycosyltransferase involved in cell wall biosynthesis